MDWYLASLVSDMMCKACMQSVIDVLFYISNNNWKEALKEAQKLVKILETYERSC